MNAQSVGGGTNTVALGGGVLGPPQSVKVIFISNGKKQLITHVLKVPQKHTHSLLKYDVSKLL